MASRIFGPEIELRLKISLDQMYRMPVDCSLARHQIKPDPAHDLSDYQFIRRYAQSPIPEENQGQKRTSSS